MKKIRSQKNRNLRNEKHTKEISKNVFYSNKRVSIQNISYRKC